MRTKFLYISVFRVALGPRVKLAGHKSALNPPLVYSTDHSKAMTPVLVLLFVDIVVYSMRRFVLSCLVLFCSCIFQSF